MEERVFKSGDRVVAIKNALDDWHAAGELGTVVVDEEWTVDVCDDCENTIDNGTYYAVRFDVADSEGDRMCYMREDAIVLAE